MNYVEVQKQNTEVSYEDYNSAMFEKLSRANSEAERRTIRNAIVLKNRGLARIVAARIYNKQEYTNVEYEDILQIAYCKLIDAVARYDLSKGVKFSTYGCFLMDREVRKYIIRKESKHAFDLQFDKLIDGNDDITYGEIILKMDEDEALQEVYHNDNCRMVNSLISGLSEQERSVVTMYYGLNGGEPMVQQKISASIGISQVTVSKILKRSLKKMQGMAEVRGIENIL